MIAAAMVLHATKGLSGGVVTLTASKAWNDTWARSHLTQAIRMQRTSQGSPERNRIIAMRCFDSAIRRGFIDC
jgi:hypothetical protein